MDVRQHEKGEPDPGEAAVPGRRVSEPARDSPLRLMLSSPLYRGATIALFLSGLGFSAAAPQIATFLVKELDASLTVAGLFYLTSLTAPVAGYLVGARSDRSGRRLGLFRLCAVAGFVGWAGIALSTQLWMPFAISALVLGFAGAATSQLFAAVHDELAARPNAANDGVVAVVRMALTAGWVVGPVAGAYLAAQAGLRTMLFATALCTLAQILPLGTLRTAPPRAAGGDHPHLRRPGLRRMWPLLAFTAMYICVYAGEPIKYAYLPIYMNRQLGFPPALSGAIIGIQPLVELALMPVAIIVARRTGMIRLTVIGAGFGIAANICFATTRHRGRTVRRTDPHGRRMGNLRHARHHHLAASAPHSRRHSLRDLPQLTSAELRTGRTRRRTRGRHARPAHRVPHPGRLRADRRHRPVFDDTNCMSRAGPDG